MKFYKLHKIVKVAFDENNILRGHNSYPDYHTLGILENLLNRGDRECARGNIICDSVIGNLMKKLVYI